MKKIYVAPETEQMEIELQEMIAASEEILVSDVESSFEEAEGRLGGSWGYDEY